MMVQHQQLKLLLYLLQPYLAYIMVVPGIQEMDSLWPQFPDCFPDCIFPFLIAVTVGALNILTVHPHMSMIFIEPLCFIHAGKIHNNQTPAVLHIKSHPM